MSATAHDSSIEALVDRLADEMARRWRDGERPLAEEYFGRNPELLGFPEAAAELIYEEVCLRQEFGEPAALEEVLGRFPQWQDQLRVLLDCHQLMQAGAALPSFPAVGDTLGEFRLEAELGRGKQGRVFLARQTVLADRPIVLKLVPLLGREHLSLARLQHTYIVPLYFVQDFADRMLRALGLPYFGGTSLQAVLESLGGTPLARRSGRSVLQAVRQAQAASPVAVPVRGPACQFLGSHSYVESVCWIGVCLAEALQYAHERGLLHLDIKPANVLLAADGQPMLLDFHLARGPLAPGGRPPDWLGGTPAYMAPEHRAAWESVRDSRPVTAALDGRADIFAFGVLLHEMLSGIRPAAGDLQLADIRQINPDVSRGLADIISKCTAPEAKARYPDAAALANDLRRHLQNLPLRGIPNRSPRERWQKWRKRRPNAPWLLALLVTGLLFLGVRGGHLARQLNHARAALSEGHDYITQHEYERAASALERGIEAAERLPLSGSIRHELAEQLRQVHEVQAAREFHQFVERLRLFAGADYPPKAETLTILQLSERFWLERAAIATLALSDTEISRDLLDLAILSCRLRLRLPATNVRTGIRQEALKILAEAERLCGPSTVLYRERRMYALALGLNEIAQRAASQADALPPHTPWEHAAVGRSMLDDGDAQGAFAQLEKSLELKPDDFWASFHMGHCARILGRPNEAVVAYSVCLALAPDSAWCYYNRGLSLLDIGNLDRALDRARRDFDRALAVDPHLAAASLQRGLLNYREKNYDAALSDLKRALADGANEARVHHGIALVYQARDDRDAAVSELHKALSAEPDYKPARELLEKLRKPG
jgi:serine/threonine protein kinase/Tfp pilus assembly protein PilF